MDFQELQTRIVRVAKDYEERYGVVIDVDFAALKLAEEVGEFTQALLIAQGRCRPDKRRPEEAARQAVAHELADIVGMAIINAHRLGVDLEEAIRQKWLHRPV